MKILTLNCQRAFHEQGLINFLSDNIAKKNFDAIFLQEMPSELFLKIKTKNKYTLIKDTSFQKSNGRVALLLSTDFEILKKDYLIFETQKTHEKKYFFELVTVIAKSSKGENYVLSSLHMPAYLKFIHRRKHLSEAVKQINTLRSDIQENTLVVAGGDWNSIFPLEKYLLKLFLDRKYKFVRTTYPTFFGVRIEPGLFWNNVVKKISRYINLNYTVDFFLVDKSVKARIEAIDARISDHNPVFIEIK